MKPFITVGRLLTAVRGQFAQQSRWRAFVSWQTYYRAYLDTEAGAVLARHTGPQVGDDSRQNALIDTMAAGRGPTVIHAPPGCGKSRFALELARRIEKERRRWEVVFVNHDESAIRAELPELARLDAVVFIVDDAQNCPELVELLATACLQAPSSAHLVCLSRPAGRARVTRALNTVFPPGAVREIDLGRPDTRLVRTLIDQLLPKASPHHRDTIQRFVRQSYFGAVLVCGILSRQAKLPQTFQRQELRSRVCLEPFSAAVQGLCPVELAVRALAVYSALAPVSKSSPEARALAAELAGLTPAMVDSVIERVVTAGLFQDDGPGLLRPTADLLGDLLLEEACLDAEGQPTAFSAQLLDRLLQEQPARVVANCAAVGQLFGTAQDVDLISTFVLDRARSLSPVGRSDLLRLLRMCRPLAACRPATTFELVKILQARGLLRPMPSVADTSGGDSPEMQACALLLDASEVDAGAVPGALRFARDLYLAAKDDPGSAQQVLHVLSGYCRYGVGRSVGYSRAVADVLHTWVLETTGQAAPLAACMSALLLGLEVHENSDGTASPSTVLATAPEILAVRDVATDTLVRALGHADANAQCAAIVALEEYARSQRGLDRERLETWRPQLTREVAAIAGGIAAAAKASTSLPLWAAAERQGWLWWTQEADFLRQAGVTILEAITGSDAYRLWKLLYAPHLPATGGVPTDIGDAVARRQHVAAFAGIDEMAAIAAARQLFNSLDERCLDGDSWKKLWRSALEQLPQGELQEHAGAILGEFARLHADVAWSFVNLADADGPLYPMLPHLLIELGKSDRARRAEEARHVLRGTRLEHAWLRALSVADELEEPELTLLARGLESSEAQTVLDTAEALLSARSSDRVPGFLIVFGAIARHPADAGLWEVALERFVMWTDVVLPPRVAEATPPMARIAQELIALFRTFAPSLRWGFQRHTRQLGKALAILSVISPSRVQEWMQRTWGQSRRSGSTWNDESPLSVSRLSEMMRAVRNSASAQHWFGVFVEWMRRDSYLGTIAAMGLGELCSLDDARIGELAAAIEMQPSDAAIRSLVEFIQSHKFDRAFAQKLLTLLEVWTQFPQSYPRVETAVIGVLVNATGGRQGASPVHERALLAIDARRSQGEVPGLLAATLERAEREVREAMEQS